MTRWLFLEKLLPAHRRAQRGQTLVIFAFLAVFMILLLGLVLDTARLFILAAEAERTAEAATLAGALYMPTYFNSLSPDGQDALNRACATAQANGVSACPVGAGQIGADVEQVTGNQYEIQVTVTLQADVFFLSYVAPNLASATVTRTAVAQYLPPIQLGSRAYAFGDETEADKVNGNPLQNFWARLNGPYEIKDHGDAYTPKWQEGPDDARTTTDLSTNVPIDRWPASWSPTTNHPQFGAYPNYQLNGDQQPSGFTGDQGLAGYNYEIVVPPGTTPLEVQIFNPAFDPPYQLDPNTPESLGDACYDLLYKISSCTYTTAGVVKSDLPGEYLQMDYALYYVPLPFERATDTLLTTFYAPSLDLYPTDLSKHGCATGQAYDPDGLTASLNGTPGCVSLPSYITYNSATLSYTNHWYPLPATQTGGTYIITNPGTYRLALEATGKYGYHQYAVKVTDTAGNPPPAGVRLWAWNDMCVYYNQSGTNSATFDLGEIPAAYAGKTLTFSLFDPGDAGGSVYMEILDPSGNPVQLPAWVRTVAGSGGKEMDASNGYYNALWLRLPIPIPATYNPTAPNDWWQVKYIATNPTDTVTASVTLSGSPIHLVSEVVG